MAKHITVLKQEAIAALDLAPDSVVVDATLGSGGHAKEMLGKLDERGVFIGLDADPEAIRRGKRTLQGDAQIHLAHCNFRDIDVALQELGITHASAILADLGWRTEQFTEGGKGFSFQSDDPLLMTYGDPTDYAFTATDIVNEWDEKDVRNVIRGYGEERFAGRIARAIVAARAAQPIQSARELAEIVSGALPKAAHRGKAHKIHPATQTFQALRIAVNDELSALEEFLEKAPALLLPGGKLAVITFHSLEDRIVKHAFRALAAAERGTIETKKPITPARGECAENPRARSAKLRIFEKS